MKKLRALLGIDIALAAVAGVLFYGFRCHHNHLSFPFRQVKPGGVVIRGESYQRCLDCGMFRRYDQERMRLIGPWMKEAPRRCWKFLEAS